MKIKDLSLTDYISGVSAIGLAISVISQSYFYFRLDALWVMSLISPTIYLFDVIKVIVFLLILVGGVIALEQFYRYLTKKFRHKKKIKYVESKSIDDLLIKNRANYERNFYIFLCTLIRFHMKEFGKYNLRILRNEHILFLSLLEICL